jgi:CHAT domain-containing protein/tetratricopeptide (TPR) repeat protein
MKLSVSISALGDWRTARALDEKIVEVYSRTLPDDAPDLQLARENLAGALYSLGDLHGARALEENVYEIRSRTLPDDHPELQDVRQDLATTIAALGDLERAQALFEKVVEVYSRTLAADDLELQRARLNLAATLAVRGDLGDARVLNERVLEVFSRTLPDDHPDLQTVRQNLSGLLSSLGDLRGARALQEKVLEVRSRTLSDDHPDLQAARINLASTLYSLGDLQGARALGEKVLDVRSRTLPEDHPDLQSARHSLAVVLGDLGDVQSARALEEKALEICSRTLPDDHPDVQWARAGLARTMRAEGDLEHARALEEKVLDVRSRTLPDDHPDLQAARQDLALTIALQRARASGKDGRDEKEAGAPWRALCVELLAAQCRSQSAAARTALLQAPAREAESSCQSMAGGLDYAISFSLGLGALDPSPELQAPCFMLSETTRAASLGSAAFMRLAAASPEYAALRDELGKRSEDLANRVQEGTTSEEFRTALFRREKTERDLIALARKLSGEKPLEWTVDAIAGTLAEHDVVVAFRRYSFTSVSSAKSNPADSVAHSEGEGAPKATSAESLCAFVLRPTPKTDASSASAPTLSLVDLGPMDTIERAVHAWRAAIGVGLERGIGAARRSDDELRGPGLELRKLVFDPLLDRIGSSDHVLVVLDDVLHLVPLEALPLSESGELIGDRLRIETRTTLLERLSPRSVGSGESLIAFGGAAFNSEAVALTADDAGSVDEKVPARVSSLLRGTSWEWGFPPLPETGEEVMSIGALHAEVFENGPEVVLQKHKASRQALQALAPKARWLHIATHGWFAPESIRSWKDMEPLDKFTGLGTRGSGEEQVKGMSPMLLCGLALAGANLPENAVNRVPGLITAEEMSALDLSRCELAVLSACDTNVGEHRAGQGVHSLQMALQMAGARSVITSLWKVPDEATRELMVDFYRRLWVERKPKWQALWEAKKKLREAKDERGVPKYSTRDWAAWVLTGDPN